MQHTNKLTRKLLKREKTTLSSSSESEKKQNSVHVFCRLKPLKEDDEEACVTLVSPTVLCLTSPSENKILRKDVEYKFQQIFTARSNQKEVFEYVAYPLLKDFLIGKNGLLFTYGVTGSGKTYTLTGDQNDPGIMPRCIDTLFNTIGQYQTKKHIIKPDKMNNFEIQSDDDAAEARKIEAKASIRSLKSDRKGGSDPKCFYKNDEMTIDGINETNLYCVFISYVEVYNNFIYDLLDKSCGKILQNKVLKEDFQKTIYVNNVVEVEVKSAAEAFELFTAGQKRKRMGNTVLNSESSRSHSIFNIRLVQLVQQVQNSQGNLVIPECNMLKVSQLSLVDLAGSERCSRTQNTGMRLKEASSINNSLMCLRICMEILRDNQLNNASRLVPYRESRLTLLFKNYFEGEGCVHMIICLNPTAQDYEENLQVMKFAEISKDVKVTKREVRCTPYRKKIVAKTITQTPSSCKIPDSTIPLIFGPEIPTIQLNLEDFKACDNTIKHLANILKARKEKVTVFKRELSSREQSFRRKLIEINHENVISKHEIHTMKSLVKQKRQCTKYFETKVRDLENVNENLVSEANEFQNVIRNLKYTIDEKDLKINQNLLEKERSKQRFVLEKEKLSQEVDEHLRRQREELHAQMELKNIKLQKVKEILDNEIIESPVAVKTESDVFDCKLNKETPTTLRTPSHYRPTSPRISRRRSRSIGDVWLEHNAVVPVPLDTVLQPTMKKRKSVNKLSKASDVLNPNQSKYCLISQEEGTDGAVETKLYKGDIVQTCGGGAQIIFNGVERLRQESPTGTPKKY